MGVVCAQYPQLVCEGLLKQGDGAGRIPRLLVGDGEVVAGVQGVGVVCAQYPQLVCEGLLKQGDGAGPSTTI
ncbi:hypothetical protein GCM10023086_76510 [Streptomyces venetus]|uniref:Uncharacterized protein n=1 Tax=Streptomyces venetus TaxID=1701086 RepID=A0ABP8HKS9_9ACTN